jgi:uncharacterized protein (DUF1330 family)
MSGILATGLLKQKSNGTRGRASKYIVTYLSEKHLPLVMALQEDIVQNLWRPDLLQAFSSDFMKQHMGRQGVVLGVFVEKRLVAFRNVYYPDTWDKEWNLGLDLGLAQEELTKVANLQMVCVHPRFRGNSLALKMNQVSLGLLRESGARHHVCATVSPYNIWNIPVLLQSGFRIAKLKSKYGGKVRYIVHQNLRRPLIFNDDRAVIVPLDDLESQKRWFDSGFYGVALNKRDNAIRENLAGNFNIVFKPPLEKNMVPTSGWTLVPSRSTKHPSQAAV